jgi:beta-1,4-mannosyltransferase
MSVHIDIPPGARTRAGLHVAMLPAPTDEQGSYLSLLRSALERAGVTFTALPSLTDSWRTGPSHDVSVVHLHWLEFIAPSDATPGVGALKTARRAIRLWLRLRSLRRRGVAIVWTVHNLGPHEPAHPVIERSLARAVLATADRAIVHSGHARDRVAATLGHADKLEVIPHGNYVDAYPPPLRPREQLRAGYDLPPDSYVYLSFGQVRPYKRLPELVEAFRRIPDRDVALLIAGEPKDSAEADRLLALARQDDRVRLELRRIPASEVTSVHTVSDAAVFAYDEMFSSGSLLLALSCGLPVVVPDAGTGSEIVCPPAMEPAGAEGLSAALAAVRSGDQRSRRQAALAAAARYDWATVGLRTETVYRAARERFEAHAT